jgi:hypothetical protein
MATKKKARFNSLSTPGHRVECSNYLVELAFLKKNKGSKLPPKFWQLQRYKWWYRKEIQACRKFVKKYGEAYVLHVALHNHITTWTDFGRVEFLLQKFAERRERLASPKDTSGVILESVKVTEDYRDFTPQPKSKGLFERLEELTRGEEEGEEIT